ncbi:MAG: LysR family transcriptional regulator [Faecalibacterium sp.]
MDEKDFELLRTLGETKNITRAAEKLFTTQSALSKRVKSLEEEFGVEILMRSRQGIRFTPAGEAMLAHADAAARQMEQLRRDLCSLDGIVGGSLVAGISINYALEQFGGCITPCTFENGEPFVRRTYILCQRDALRLPQVEAFVEAVKRGR